MKIVHIITRLILGGAQENTLLSCVDAASRGHEVTLLAGPPRADAEGPEGDLLDEAQRRGVHLVLVPALVRPVHPVHDPVAAADLLKHLRERRPDVVHTHASKAGILGRWAARRTRVPCIVHTIHGLAFDAYQPAVVRLAYRAAERRAARWGHRLVAVCRAMADRAEAAGLAPPGTVRVVYSGMETERFARPPAEAARAALRAAWGAGPADCVFVQLARLFPMKGHRLLVAAMAEVCRRHPRARLVLVGSGTLEAALRADARRLGIADRVHVAGLAARERVPACLWAADAVVHASLREGLARAVVQAALCKRPVVSYDIGGAREVLTDGQTGRLVPPPPSPRPTPDAVAALAEALAPLAGDAALRQRMGAAWAPDLARRFDYRTMGRRLVDVYEGVLGGPPDGEGDAA